MKISFKKLITPAVMIALYACNNQEQLNSANTSALTQQIDVAQTSGQLASGTSFRINGSSTDSTSTEHPRDHHGHKDNHAPLDGLSLLPPTDELLAIADAESAGDFRGMRMSHDGGATITNYDASGNEVTLAQPQPHDRGPQGCSFSGKQFPDQDSILSTIVKTVIDFGSGVTFHRDTITIVRAGKITITRSGDLTNMTEATVFENYSVNGIKIEGTKTRISTFDSTTGSGSSTTTVSGGKITLADGTVTTWTTQRSRTSSITLDAETNRPVSGTIVTEVQTSVSKPNGDVLYSHKSTKPLTENVACERRHHGPVSGTIETIYGSDTIVIDFGDGSCDNQTITLTINGVSTTKTIGE
jgi:hypothetical protein